jgi:hypothetical protein
MYLDAGARELQAHGLQRDWMFVTWEAVLGWKGRDWSNHSFQGVK